MPPSLPERAFTVTLIALLAFVLLFLCSGTARSAESTCTHFASPQGTGATCTQSQPCKVASWWPLAGPGTTLCLLDGIYQGRDSMIQPPAGIAGTQAQPITVRALTDGQVLLDAQSSTFAVWIPAGNDWYVIEGFNARRGTEFTYQFASSHNRGRRLIAWEGTSGQDDSNMFRTGRQVDNIYEDCAAWGKDSRKIFDGAQSQAPNAQSQWSGYRRCWGEFSDFPAGVSNPTNTYQMGYRTRQQRHENVLGTFNLMPGGQMGAPDGVVSHFYDCAAASLSMQGSQVLGSVFYALPGASSPVGSLVSSFCTSDAAWKEVVAFVGPGFPQTKPFYWINQTSTDTPRNNTCDTCVSVHNGSPSHNDSRTGWTLPHWHEGPTLEAATDGQSIFTLLPGLCTRYEGGQLTTQPLWPWPMNQRIKEARVQSGYPAVDVTATMEAMFGPIPAACRTGGTPPPPGDTTPPTVRMVAPSPGALVSGSAVALSATATDNVAVVGVQFAVDGTPTGAEPCCNQPMPTVHASTEIDTTMMANGLYTLTAVARDAAGQRTTSEAVHMLVFNGTSPPTPPGPHPALACTGTLAAVPGAITMQCVPQPAQR